MNNSNGWQNYGGIKPNEGAPGSFNQYPINNNPTIQHHPPQNQNRFQNKNNYNNHGNSGQKAIIDSIQERCRSPRSRKRRGGFGRNKAFRPQPPAENMGRSVAHPPKTDIHQSIDDKLKILEKVSAKYTILAIQELARLIRREDVELNTCNEDIELLTNLLFNGLHYRCPCCKVTCTHASTMQENHLKSVLHSQNASKLDDPPSYAHLLSIKFSKEFFETISVQKVFNELFDQKITNDMLSSKLSFNCKFSQVMCKKPQSEEIILAHRSTTTIVIKNRTSDLCIGEEFIVPVSGFHCSLCKVLIPNGTVDNIFNHLSHKIHQHNLKRYLLRLPLYSCGYANQEYIKKHLDSPSNTILLSKDDNSNINLPFPIEWRLEDKSAILDANNNNPTKEDTVDLTLVNDSLNEPPVEVNSNPKLTIVSPTNNNSRGPTPTNSKLVPCFSERDSESEDDEKKSQLELLWE